MTVKRLSTNGSVTTNKVDYPSMLAGYGDFGAMQRIASTTFTSAGDVTFTNIPQNFQDLMVVAYARSGQSFQFGGFFGGFNFNYGGNTNYSTTTLNGDGSSATSFRQTNQAGIWGDGYIPALSSTSGIFGAATMHILNYANTSTFKTYLLRTAADINGAGNTSLTAGLWRQTAAINAIYLTGSINFQPGTRISLYGIKASAA